MTGRRAKDRAGRSLPAPEVIARQTIRWTAAALFASIGVFETQAGAETLLNPPVTIHVDDTVYTLAIDMHDLVEAYVPVTVSTVTIAKAVPGYPDITPATAGDLFLIPSLSTGTPQVSGSLLGGTPEQSSFGTFTQAAPAVDLVLRLGDGTPVAASHLGSSSGSLFSGTFYFEVPPTFADATLEIDLGTIGPQGFNDGSGHTASALMGSIGPISIAVPASDAGISSSRALPGGTSHQAPVPPFPWIALALVIAVIAFVAAAGYAIARSMRKRTLRDELFGNAPAPPPEHLLIPAAELIAYLAVTGAIDRAGDDFRHAQDAGRRPDHSMPFPIALPPVSTNGADEEPEHTDEPDQPYADEAIGPEALGELPPGIAPSAIAAAADLEPRAQALMTEEPEPNGEPTDAAPMDARVMGVIEVDGFVAEPSRAMTTEIVVFLCLHPNREFSADELAGLIWEGRTLGATDQTVRTYMGYVRQAVGPERLCDARKSGYRLVGAVDTDWRRFEALYDAARLARSDDPAEAIRMLAAALSLIRGQPFTRPKGARGDAYSWAQSSGLGHEMGATIEACAHLCVELLRRTGDPEGARWAIAQGLRGTRYSVVLCEDRLRIETDRAGLQRAFKAVKAILGKGVCDVLPAYDEVARKIG